MFKFEPRVDGAKEICSVVSRFFTFKYFNTGFL